LVFSSSCSSLRPPAARTPPCFAGVPKFIGVKWKFQTNGRVISSPAVENGLVYVGSMNKNLYAVDQQTGALKWKFAAEGPVVSSPAPAGGIVYFASDDGKFYAPDAATDQLKWKLETAGERRYAGRHLHGLLPAADTMPDPWDYFLLLPRCRTLPCISVAAMATCMPWTPCRAA
jgi:eukaryotic-like serine/threonine-protein kinase